MARDMPPTLAAALDGSPVPGVVSVYLFGSHASGRVHRESDVDVGVVLDRVIHATPQARFDARLRLTAHVGQQLGTADVDLVVLNDAPPHLVRRVMTDGVRVSCADADADHAARRTALLRAADLEPFLCRARKAKLQAMVR